MTNAKSEPAVKHAKDHIDITDDGIWIDDDGDDVTPVFAVSFSADHYHRVYSGCTDPAESQVVYDRFAAELEGLDPCSRCFDTGEERGDR